jgi:hypothetical protein
VKAFDWFFRNRTTGAITISQFPNVPLWIFLAATAAAWIAPTDSTVEQVVRAIAALALGWWAADEIGRGVNPWRRLLGAAGLAFALMSLVRVF